MLMSPVMIIEV